MGGTGDTREEVLSSEFWVLSLETDKKSETRAIRLVYLVCFV